VSNIVLIQLNKPLQNSIQNWNATLIMTTSVQLTAAIHCMQETNDVTSLPWQRQLLKSQPVFDCCYPTVTVDAPPMTHSRIFALTTDKCWKLPTAQFISLHLW